MGASQGQGGGERELIRRILSGERDAFAELVRLHHARVRGLCLSLLGDAALADDAAQEVFLKAFRALARFQGGASLSTWLHRIASNHCLDLLRAQARRPADSLDALLEREGDRVERLLEAPAGRSPSAEDADLVRRALDAMPPEYRLILTLREMQGLTYAELTETLDCSLDSVKARLRRARQSFEKAWRHIQGAGGV